MQRRRPLEVRGPAFLSSAAERGPASQALVSHSSCPHSTIARIWWASKASGAALTTLADSALSPSSFHHSGFSIFRARGVCARFSIYLSIHRPRAQSRVVGLRVSSAGSASQSGGSYLGPEHLLTYVRTPSTKLT